MKNRVLNIVVALLALLVLWVEFGGYPVEKNTASLKSASGDSGEVWVSPAGLVYGDDPSVHYGSRIDHVMAHTKEDTTKFKHSVFLEKDRQKLLELLDEAWKIRGPPERQGGAMGRDVYTVDLRRVIGTKGERALRLVVEAGTGEVVTGYPVGE